MIRSSKYESLIKASLEWWKPNIVAYIEWVCEMQCEILVAIAGGLPLKRQDIEILFLYLLKKSFVIRWHNEV